MAVLLGVLVVVAAVAVATGASAPSAPSVTATPAVSPTNSNTMRLVFGSPGNNTYQCRLDAAAFAACSSPKVYGSNAVPVTVGSHTFQVKAVDNKGNQSSASSYTWVVERTAPTVVSVSRAAATPTKAASVAWTVTFNEAVKNVVAGNFTLVKTNLTGVPVITAVSGSGAIWTVTASTGAGTTGATGSLGLNLSGVGSISDLAGNALTGSLPFVGQVYTVDKTAPGVQFTTVPPDPDNSATANFVWVQDPAAADFDHYECSVENGAFVTAGCAPSPFVVDTSNNGQHQFAVRAYDATSNFTEISYKWKVERGSIQDFTISGNSVGLLYPGGAARPIALVLHNPNTMPITVTSLTVAVVASSLPSGCASSAFGIEQSNVASNNVVIPAGGSLTLPSGATTAPTVTMADQGNQDPCRNASFSFSYSGSAHS